jgi:hypothetical protein
LTSARIAFVLSERSVLPLETLMTADDYFKLMLKKLETEHTTVGA